jgi:hypothetical protein
VSAACQEVTRLSCRDDSATKVYAGYRPAGSFASAIFTQSNNDGWLAQPFLDPTGDNSNNSGVPTGRGHDRDWGIGCGAAKFQRLFSHCRLNRTPFFVETVEFGCKRMCFCWILSGQQPNAEVSLTNPPACIDAGPKGKAKLMSARQLVDPSHISQCGKPNILTPSQNLKALGYKCPIEAF